MRLMIVAVTVLVGVGPAWADAITDEVTNIEARLRRAPGSYVGSVPGGSLTANMRPTPESQLQSLPVIDVDKGCGGVALCIAFEQEAYNDLKIAWPDLDLNDRDVCLVTTKAVSQGINANAFYRRIKLCIDARLGERNALESLRPRHFQP